MHEEPENVPAHPTTEDDPNYVPPEPDEQTQGDEQPEQADDIGDEGMGPDEPERS